MAIDRFGRNLHYLRISLTDHCNLRCVYCMPEDMVFQPNSELMQDDELLTLTNLFAQLGFDKIRLTGGEPTLRKNVVTLVGQIAATPGIQSITMTTNGILLPRLADKLAQAGLKRVNISLDTLNERKFHTITRWGTLKDVWEGIKSAEQAGLTPIKINAVVVRNYNEEDVIDLAKLTLEHAWQIRFIEMMPLGGATEFQKQLVVSADEIAQRVSQVFGELQPIHNGDLDGEARVYQIPGALGEVGFIASVTKPFCSQCTRARLTADGRLRLCLLREGEIDLLTPLRQGASQAELRQLIIEGLWEKPWGHGLANNEIAVNRVMNQIGG
ncbi:MAG: GTP 3',8-cyclase MoaA [Anaerolineales bacterium]